MGATIMDTPEGPARAGAKASAPGKVILFGEHAVVYGEPAIAVALSLRTEVTIRETQGDRVHRVNGAPMNQHHHAYIKDAVDHLWKGGFLDVRTESRLPSASGLGSSAALSVATTGALLQLQDRFSEEMVVSPDTTYPHRLGEELVAREAYNAEWSAQKGRGSPTDTSTSTHGRAIMVDAEKGPGYLWDIARGERRWYLHHLDIPPLTLVVGYTGQRGRTADEVAKVGRFVKRGAFARDIMRDLGKVTREARVLMEDREKMALGLCMDEAHNLLTVLGVSTAKLDALCDAAREHAYGAKLTGSGGGGSMIALTDTPDACAKAIAKRGGYPTVVNLGGPGVSAHSI
ncbi:MAG TPA: mevalonate kinase [Candidatus Thermoplasmatota archaeon]|nr:mevalonate kinase [Candidatus Thermoplasmatota archaeon]